MASDSSLFCTGEQLMGDGYVLGRNVFVHLDDVYLPLYEAKMLHQFDHRHGTFDGQSEQELRRGLCREPSSIEHADSRFLPLPRYWVSEHDCVRAAGYWIDEHRWFIAFRRITRAVDRRTASFCILPWSGAGDSVFFALARPTARVPAFLANVNSIPFDFVVRQKMAGINLSFYIVKQLPVLPPDRYTPRLLDFIVPRVLELIYTAWDLQPFAQDVLDKVGPETWARWFETDHLGSPSPVHTSPPPAWAPDTSPPPFVWDEERRFRLRAELDALYAHLYGLTREELDYVLETFPIVKRKDEAQYGEYRTKRVILEKYEEVESLTH